MAIPVQILLQAGKCSDVLKRYTPPIPKNAQPLDALELSGCYVGQVVYDEKTNKCYTYTGETFASWKEIVWISNARNVMKTYL